MIHASGSTWTTKTAYDWCLEDNIRILNLDDWLDSSGDELTNVFDYHVRHYTREEFDERIKRCKVKRNSRARKMDEFLELRMYGFVIYQLSGIQKGIQFQHAVTEYERYVPSELRPRYERWADKWKTSIVLNGGTTNDCIVDSGSMQKYYNDLLDNDIFVQEFNEPDLNDSMTAFCFIADERVFDRESYPDFEPTPFTWDKTHKQKEATYNEWERMERENYEKWLEKIGNKKNAFLRSFLKDKKLA